MIKFLLLGLLAGHPRHGYELKAMFEELFGGTWPLNPGQVYMTLQKLEDEGLVTSERRRAGAAPRPPRLLDHRGRPLRAQAMDDRADATDRSASARRWSRRCSPRSSPTTAHAIDLIWAQRRHHLQAIAQLRDKKNDR